MEGVVVLESAAPTRGEDQLDRLLAAADRTGLRALPDQTARISWQELGARLSRRQKNDECPPAAVTDLAWQISRLRKEKEQVELLLRPKTVPTTAIAKQNTNPAERRSLWGMTEEEYQARTRLQKRLRELPNLIFTLEKELEKAKWVPKAEQHLRGLIHRPGKDYEAFNRNPEEFDLQLQGLLPQLRDGELFVVLAEVIVEGSHAEVIYGVRTRRVDFRPFMVHLPKEYKDVVRRAAGRKILFCGYCPEILI